MFLMSSLVSLGVNCTQIEFITPPTTPQSPLLTPRDACRNMLHMLWLTHNLESVWSAATNEDFPNMHFAQVARAQELTKVTQFPLNGTILCGHASQEVGCKGL